MILPQRSYLYILESHILTRALGKKKKKSIESWDPARLFFPPSAMLLHREIDENILFKKVLREDQILTRIKKISTIIEKYSADM